MSLRVGILGAGQAGERQAVGFAAHPEARIVAVADLDEGRAAALAGRFGAAVTRDAGALFGLGLDVVVVALPHHLHVGPAEEAASRGVHVMMEKPLATTLEDGGRIVRACRDGGVRLALSFVHRYREEVRRAKAWLERAGAPQVVRESMAAQRTAAHPGWITRREAGGGVLMYSAIHGVDRLRWFVGSEIVEVDARTRRYAPDTEVEDGVAAMLVFANGAIGTLSANAPRYRAQPAPWETEVVGDRGRVRVRTREWADFSSDDGSDRYLATDDPDTAVEHYNFARQAADFIDAVTTDRPPAVSGEDGLRALEVCLAIYLSAAERRPVGLDEMLAGRSE